MPRLNSRCSSTPFGSATPKSSRSNSTPWPLCLEAADANNDGKADIADAVSILGFLFGGGVAALPDPGAPPNPCGPDPEAAGPQGDLGCRVYVSCE